MDINEVNRNSRKIIVCVCLIALSGLLVLSGCQSIDSVNGKVKDEAINPILYKQGKKYITILNKIYKNKDSIPNDEFTTIMNFIKTNNKKDLNKKERKLIDGLVILVSSDQKVVNKNYKDEHKKAIKELKDIYGSDFPGSNNNSSEISTKRIKPKQKKQIKDFESKIKKVIASYSKKWSSTTYDIRNQFESNGTKNSYLISNAKKLTKQYSDLPSKINKIVVPKKIPKNIVGTLIESKLSLSAAVDMSSKFMEYYLEFWGGNTLTYTQLNSALSKAINDQNEFDNTINKLNDKFGIKHTNYFTYTKANLNLYSEGKKDPKIGMTKEEARNSSWGQPEDINKTITSGDTSEQWVYPDNKYLYFDNGILTGIQK